MSKARKLLIPLIIAYFVILVWFLIFEFNIYGLTGMPNFWNVHRWYSIIPFKTYYHHYDPPRLIAESLFNFISFVPVGLIAAYMSDKKLKYLWAFLMAAGFGLIIELAQYFSMYGFLDGSDYVLYLGGSLLGCLIGDIIKRHVSKETADRLMFGAECATIPLAVVAIIVMIVFHPVYPY